MNVIDRWQSYVYTVLASLLLCISLLSVQASEHREPVDHSAPLPEGVTEAPDWFPVGETLNYNLYWGIIPVGRASLSTDWVTVGTRTLLRIKTTARTTAIVRALYPVNDYVESLVDPSTMLPVQYLQQLNEGRKHRNDRIVFDHGSKRAVWRNDKTDEAHVLIISEDTRDILAFTYYMRSKAYDEKTGMTADVIVDEKLYNLTIKGVRTEQIKINGIEDKVPCFVMEPHAQFGEIFSRKGVVHIWCTQDARRLCAKLLAFLPFADFTAELNDFSRNYAPVTNLVEVDVMYNLLDRPGLNVYQADRSIKDQRAEEKAEEAFKPS